MSSIETKFIFKYQQNVHALNLYVHSVPGLHNNMLTEHCMEVELISVFEEVYSHSVRRAVLIVNCYFFPGEKHICK